jgi:TolB-like protein/DNA-binding SARP family transcriptional activator
MFNLRLLGGTVLEGEDGPLTGPATQRHRLALLALLAVGYPRAWSRDKLVAFLWPERATGHARNLLNQAVHALRKALGEEAIVSTGDDLRFESAAVDADVIAFEEALRSGDHEGAVTLYRGPFLDGFFLSDAPEFERWAAAERQRLADARAIALESLAEAAVARRDFPVALEWWKERAAHDPLDSRVALCLMRTLEGTGNRAAALQHAAIHQRLLQEEFGAEPDPEVLALAERLRTHPTSAPALARAGEPSPRSTPGPGSNSGDEARHSIEPLLPIEIPPARSVLLRPFPWYSVGLAGALVLGLAGALSVGWLLPGSNPLAGAATADGSGGGPAIAVLPFENLTGRDEDAALANGIHSDLITALSGVAALTVISRASVLPYRERPTPLSRIGEELKVDVLLEGGVQRLHDRVRINVQLSDATTGMLLWAERYDRELTVGNLFALQSEITDRVVTALKASLTTADRERLAIPPTEELTAYVFYHRAGEAYDGTRAGNEESERLLRLALQADPLFAPAWASLGANYGWRPPYLGYPTSAWDSALAYSQRAIELDPHDAGGYTTLALTLGHQGYLHRQEAAAREALRHNPSGALAFRRLAESYRERGAFVEALRYHLESVRLSPNGLQFRTWVGYVYMDLEEIAQAEQRYRSVLTLEPDFLYALQGVVILHLQRAQPDSAMYYSERILARYPDETIALANAAMVGHYSRDFEHVIRHAGRAVEIAEPGAPVRELYSLLATTMLGFALHRTGDAVRGDSLLDQSLEFLEGLIARGTDAPRWPYEVALIHAVRGDTEGAITGLQTAYDQGFRWTWMLEREPMLDPLRQDYRFRGLVTRVRADVVAMRRQVAENRIP